jgi:aminopeptidase N
VQSQTRATWTSVRTRAYKPATFAAMCCAGLCFSFMGCGGPQVRKPEGGRKAPTPPSPYAIDKCNLDVSLQPVSHRLEATATVTISQKEQAHAQGGKLQLQLHRDLGIDSIHMGGKPVTFRRVPEPVQSQPASEPATATTTSSVSDPEKPAATYELDWKPARGQPGTLVIRYGGCLYQDVSAGEKPGQIHNLEVKAHVGEEGIFLSEDGAWYPQLPQPDVTDGFEIELTQFELTATEVPGMVLVASGDRNGAELNKPRGSRSSWRSPFPLHGLALVGGPHEIHQRQVEAVLVSVHLSKDHAALAPGLLDAVESYLKLYQPLIGRYPYVEFTVVENFFSSGFAFPGFTVLASAVIAMGPLGLEPGYLDHELLHNWWGNGVFVSGLDGNWCECLTSYCANYMRHVLEGRDKKARAVRRDICYGLSRLSPDKDKPLGRFGHDDGPEGFIGYQKGSMVFAMLSQKVGSETLWRALRRLRQERLGKPTTWEQIRQVVERESDQSLEAFFKQWVRGTGIPDIVVDEAGYDARARRLTVTVTQKGRQAFDVSMPIRLAFENRGADDILSIKRPAQVLVLKSMDAPKYIELDPDFYVMRRIPLKDVMPTISGIGKSKSLLIVRTEEDFEAYQQVAELMEERYKDADGTSVRHAQAAELKSEDLKQGHVLMLGKACLATPAQELLKGQTLAIGDGFFTVGDKRYDKPTDEVLCCVRNEEVPGGVFCFYYGNSEKALKKARVITFYGGNSLVVFEDGKATYRQDFERAEQVIVQNEAR